MNRPLGLTQVLPENEMQTRQGFGTELQISWVITAGSLSCASNIEELVSECSDADVRVSVYLGLGLLLCRPVFNPGLLTQVVPQSKKNITHEDNVFNAQELMWKLRDHVNLLWFGVDWNETWMQVVNCPHNIHKAPTFHQSLEVLWFGPWSGRFCLLGSPETLYNKDAPRKTWSSLPRLLQCLETIQFLIRCLNLTAKKTSLI